MKIIEVKNILPWASGKRPKLFNRDIDEHVVKNLEKYGFRVYRINGSNVHNHETLFRELSTTFEFLHGCGENWDGFHDLFGDIPEEHGRVAIIWEHANNTMNNNLSLFLDSYYNLMSVNVCEEYEGNEMQTEVFFSGYGSGFKSI